MAACGVMAKCEAETCTTDAAALAVQQQETAPAVVVFSACTKPG